MIPNIIVKKIDPLVNASFIARYVNPAFLAKNKSRPFAEGVYELYPCLKGKINNRMTTEQIYEVVEPVVLRELRFRQEELEQRVELLQQEFAKFHSSLIQKMIQIFEFPWPEREKEFVCYVGYLPRCPRNCVTKEFFVSSSMDIETNLKAAIHEMNHFIFYEKWMQMYEFAAGTEPMHPEPLWFLEELIVDPILNEPELQTIAPIPQKAYEQFYTEQIEEKIIMDQIKDLYQHKTSMAQFLEQGHEYLKRHQKEIIEKCG